MGDEKDISKELLAFADQGTCSDINDSKIQRCKTAFEASGNPLYVWEAIRDLFDTKLTVKHELPEWCRLYMQNCAENVMGLATLRKPPEYQEGLQPDEAAKLTASAFGFVAGNKNAFREYRTHLKYAFNQSDYRSLRKQGLSRQEAIETILRKSGLIDERTLTRRFSIAARDGVAIPIDEP